MKGFYENQYLLTEPQRWLRGNNVRLGNDLNLFRSDLLTKKQIDLNSYTSIERYYFKADDLHNPTSDYYKVVSCSLSEESLLIIHPISTSIQPRLNLVKKFKNRLMLLESIDEKDFYNFALKFDEIPDGHIAIRIEEVCAEIFNKSELEKWFNNKGLITKTKAADKEFVLPLKSILTELESKSSLIGLKKALIEVNKLPLLNVTGKRSSIVF